MQEVQAGVESVQGLLFVALQCNGCMLCKEALSMCKGYDLLACNVRGAGKC